MSTVPTTFPNPPAGQLNPEVPLGVSSTLVEDPLSQDIKPFSEENLSELQWIYSGKFSITDQNPVGTHLWSWDSFNPLGNLWKTTIDEDGMVINLPQSLKKPYFASFCNVEWYIKFEPIKVTDSRAEVLYLVEYDGRINNSSLVFGDAKSSDYNAENIQFVFDDPHKCVIVKPPLYQMVTKLPNNDYLQLSPTSLTATQLRPVFVPTTSVSLKLKSKFVHNNLQPDSFDVNVWIAPVVRSISQMHSRLLNNNVIHEDTPVLVYSPMPWWLQRDLASAEQMYRWTYPNFKINNGDLKGLVEATRDWISQNKYADSAIKNTIRDKVIKI